MQFGGRIRLRLRIFHNALTADAGRHSAPHPTHAGAGFKPAPTRVPPACVRSPDVTLRGVRGTAPRIAQPQSALLAGMGLICDSALRGPGEAAPTIHRCWGAARTTSVPNSAAL